jgi:hypothetical protein
MERDARARCMAPGRQQRPCTSRSQPCELQRDCMLCRTGCCLAASCNKHMTCFLFLLGLPRRACALAPRLGRCACACAALVQPREHVSQLNWPDTPSGPAGVLGFPGGRYSCVAPCDTRRSPAQGEAIAAPTRASCPLRSRTAQNLDRDRHPGSPCQRASLQQANPGLNAVWGPPTSRIPCANRCADGAVAPACALAAPSCPLAPHPPEPAGAAGVRGRVAQTRRQHRPGPRHSAAGADHGLQGAGGAGRRAGCMPPNPPPPGVRGSTPRRSPYLTLATTLWPAAAVRVHGP